MVRSQIVLLDWGVWTTDYDMDRLWLGYDGLDLSFRDIVAVLLYQPALDVRIAQTYGAVPLGVQAVVVTADGEYLPARWTVVQLRRRWADWRGQGIADKER